MTGISFDDYFRPNSTRVLGRRRDAALAHRTDLHGRLHQLETRLRSMHDERLAIVDRLTRLRDRLWPRYRHGPRRFPAVDEAPDPPVRADARPLSGRELRTSCLGILHRHGPLPLRELDGMLNRYGYEVAGPRPVQALSDAMRYETDNLRARRLRRGVYGLTPTGERAATLTSRALGSAMSWADHPDEDLDRPGATVDPSLRMDPDAWIPRPWAPPAVNELDDRDDAVARGEDLIRQHIAARARIASLIESASPTVTSQDSSAEDLVPPADLAPPSTPHPQPAPPRPTPSAS